MKALFITIAITLLCSLSHALEKKVTSETKKAATAENIKKIKVHGMACPMCQSKAEKKFKENKNVKSIDVDMDKMLITLQLHSGKDISESVIKPIIESLGLSYVGLVK